MSSSFQRQSCPKCESQGAAAFLVKSAASDAFCCPRCHARFDDEKSIRTAAGYGGTGSGPSPWSPGMSPFAGGKKGGNYGINDFGIDMSFDAIISRTHNPPQDDPERNIEKRLEPMHSHHEEDAIPYLLSPAQRKKLKTKKQVRRHFKEMADSDRSVDENSVEFIRNNFNPKPEHMRTLEESLFSAHRVQPKKHKFEDEVPPQIKPERVHTAAPITMHGRNTVYGPSNTEHEREITPYNVENFRLKHPFGIGNAITHNTGMEVDRLLGETYKADFGGGEGYNVETLLDYPNADQIGPHSAPKTPAPLSSVEDIDSALDPFLTIEQKNERQRREKSRRLPNDPYSQYSEHEYKGEGKEPLGVADKYPGGSFHPQLPY